MTEHRFHVQVGHYQAVLESGTTGDHRSVRRADDAGPVKHQLVLSAHRVEVGHEHPVVGGPGGDHPLPLAGFSGMEWRRIDVDDHLGAGFTLHCDGTYRVPDVFADAHAHRRSVDDVHRALHPAPEIAVFVEDAVVGQVHLVVPVQDPTVVDDRRGVGDVVLAGQDVGTADERCDAPRGGGHALHGQSAIGQKRRLEQQVFGRISGDGQFRKGDHVRVTRPRVLDQLDDPGGVAGNVADDGVELGQGQPESAGALHRRIIT